ncbi:hypothetical protein TNCV_2672501 [Trichonephila clavipes]|nr:hypothetical protein TNCV_2672501 [Trichonephila clavipes]
MLFVREEVTQPSSLVFSNGLSLHSMVLGWERFLSDTSNYTRSFPTCEEESSRWVSHGHWFRGDVISKVTVIFRGTRVQRNAVILSTKRSLFFSCVTRKRLTAHDKSRPSKPDFTTSTCIILQESSNS